MKNLRILLGVAVAIAACSLLLNILSGSRFEWNTANGGNQVNIQIGSATRGEGAGLLGTLSVIALVMLAAFYSKSIAPRGETSAPQSFLEFLRTLTTSEKDRSFGGVCGGLGQHTPVPSWVWRLGFVILVFCYGTGLGAYLLLWIFVPDERVRRERDQARAETAAS